jgi:hypothetical protein
LARTGAIPHRGALTRRLQGLAVACALALVGLALGPIAARAQAGVSTSLTPDQVRSAFVLAGYTADQPLTWDWLSPPLTSFHAYDQRRGRVLVVRVYPDLFSAKLAASPHAAPGYGPTMWFENVALAAACEDDLARLADVDVHRQVGTSETPHPGATMDLPKPVLDDDLLSVLVGASAIAQ